MAAKEKPIEYSSLPIYERHEFKFMVGMHANSILGDRGLADWSIEDKQKLEEFLTDLNYSKRTIKFVNQFHINWQSTVETHPLGWPRFKIEKKGEGKTHEIFEVSSNFVNEAKFAIVLLLRNAKRISIKGASTLHIFNDNFPRISKDIDIKMKSYNSKEIGGIIISPEAKKNAKITRKNICAEICNELQAQLHSSWDISAEFNIVDIEYRTAQVVLTHNGGEPILIDLCLECYHDEDFEISTPLIKGTLKQLVFDSGMEIYLQKLSVTMVEKINAIVNRGKHTKFHKHLYDCYFIFTHHKPLLEDLPYHVNRLREEKRIYNWSDESLLGIIIDEQIFSGMLESDNDVTSAKCLETVQAYYASALMPAYLV